MKKSRWIYFTVLVAALPIIIRIFVSLLTLNLCLSSLVNSIDFVYFGLTLNLTNINELNSLKITRKSIISQKEKEQLSIWSVLVIIVLSIILGLQMFGLQYATNGGQEIINPWTMLVGSILLAIVSFFLSLKVINKINSLEV